MKFPFDLIPTSGTYGDRLELHFEDRNISEKFAITRKLHATVISREDYNALKPTEPYVKKEYRPRQTEGNIIPGERPERFAEIRWIVPLPKSDIPGGLARILSSGSEEHVIETLKKSFLPPVLTPETYNRQFRVLLHIEEYRSEQVYQCFNVSLNSELLSIPLGKISSTMIWRMHCFSQLQVVKSRCTSFVASLYPV